MARRRGTWRYLGSALILAGSLFSLNVLGQSSQSTQGTDVGLEGELAAIARELATAVRAAGESALAIGQFVGPPQLASSAGPGIAKGLGDALKTEGIALRLRANLGVQGKYQIIDAATAQGTGTGGAKEARLSGELADLSGRTLHSFARTIRDPAAIALLFGPTGNILRGETARADRRDGGIIDLVTDPRVTLDGFAVRPSPQSPYGIELCVKKPGGAEDYWLRQPRVEEGMAFVPIRRDEVYALNLVNHSPYDAAVRVTIDGLNIFSFSENKQYKHFIVKAKSAKLIKGWHRTNALSEEFLVTRYGKSAAAETGVPEASPDLGTITATFARAWPEGNQPPPPRQPDPREPATAPGDEQRPASEPGAAYKKAGPDATGRGEKVQANYREVLRHVGPIRAVASIRYSRSEDTPAAAPPAEAPLAESKLMFAGTGWLEIAATTARIRFKRQVLATAQAGDVFRFSERRGDWARVFFERPDHAFAEGWVFLGNVNVYQEP